MIYQRKTTMLLLTLVIFSIVVVSGCSSDRTYDQPSEVTGQATSIPSNAVDNKEINTKTEEKKPSVMTFDVGDTATDGELEITLNNIRYESDIDEKDNMFAVAEASSGKQYVILDITVQNTLDDETQTVSTLMQTEIVDSDGYAYDLDFAGVMALDKAFNDGDILPGMKRRGELAYEVPVDSKDLKFLFKFDLLGTTAVFNL